MCVGCVLACVRRTLLTLCQLSSSNLLSAWHQHHARVASKACHVASTPSASQPREATNLSCTGFKTADCGVCPALLAQVAGWEDRGLGGSSSEAEQAAQQLSEDLEAYGDPAELEALGTE